MAGLVSEKTQFSYFQQVGGLEFKPVMGELGYGKSNATVCTCKVLTTLVTWSGQTKLRIDILSYGRPVQPK